MMAWSRVQQLAISSCATGPYPDRLEREGRVALDAGTKYPCEFTGAKAEVETLRTGILEPPSRN